MSFIDNLKAMHTAVATSPSERFSLWQGAQSPPVFMIIDEVDQVMIDMGRYTALGIDCPMMDQAIGLHALLAFDAELVTTAPIAPTVPMTIATIESLAPESEPEPTPTKTKRTRKPAAPLPVSDRAGTIGDVLTTLETLTRQVGALGNNHLSADPDWTFPVVATKVVADGVDRYLILGRLDTIPTIDDAGVVCATLAGEILDGIMSATPATPGIGEVWLLKVDAATADGVCSSQGVPIRNL